MAARAAAAARRPKPQQQQQQQQQRRRRRVACTAKGGFGALLAKKRGKAKGEGKNAAEVCPCGGGEEKLAYSACCKPYVVGEVAAETPKRLLRSRFAAYSKGKVQYLVDTTHPENPAWEGSAAESGKVVSTMEEDIAATCEKVAFFAPLETHLEESDKESGDAAIVFSYECAVVGQKGSKMGKREKIVERSLFRQADDGRWLWLGGDTRKDVKRA